MKEIYLIAAVDEEFGIGKDGVLPWDLKKEMKHFQSTTTESESDLENSVIMGRSTWDSIPEKHRPLRKRTNIVLTRNPEYKSEGAVVMNSINAAIEKALEVSDKVFVIGGGRVYTDAIKHPDVTGVYLTKIKKNYDCDTFFPNMPESFTDIKSLGTEKEGEVEYEFLLYKKRP